MEFCQGIPVQIGPIPVAAHDATWLLLVQAIAEATAARCLPGADFREARGQLPRVCRQRGPVEARGAGKEGCRSNRKQFDVASGVSSSL